MTKNCLKTGFFLFAVLLSCLFVSCAGAGSASEGDSSAVSFSLSGSDFARNMTQTPSFDGYYVVAAMHGDHEQTKTLILSATGTQTVTFDDIPVGAKIWGEVQVFHNSYSNIYFHQYEGKSGAITIAEGNNIIPITLKTLATGTPQNYSGDQELNLGLTNLSLYPSTGKYTITHSGYSISEGTYTGSIAAGNLVLKEWAYKPYSEYTESLDTTTIAGITFVMLETPASISVTFGTNSLGQPVFGFTPSSGHYLSFSR